MKKQGFDFRKTLKHKINTDSVFMLECQSKSSPQCFMKFNKTRLEQVSCIKCLANMDLLEAHPLLKIED